MATPQDLADAPRAAPASSPAVDRVLAALSPDDAQYAVRAVEGILQAAFDAGASDVHFQPAAQSLEISWRIDGVLQQVGATPRAVAANVTSRLKVLARLLTYQSSVPQEGRIAAGEAPCEVRISTLPTIFGEKVVARLLPGRDDHLTRIDGLGLPAEIVASLQKGLRETSGAVIVAGPAGSGKTTTAYATLREIADGARSVVSLEDPVEVVVDGVAQAQVDEAAGFTLAGGLRSLVRQDPEVMFIGEIRDAESANVALQAALTGQLVITTFHANDAAGALSRLADMGAPPYAIRSAVRCIVAQRLMRRLCSCAQQATAAEEALGLDASAFRVAVGCQACHGTGYSGRLAVAEILDLDAPRLAAAVLACADATALAAASAADGTTCLFDRAVEEVARGATSPAELRRVFGTP